MYRNRIVPVTAAALALALAAAPVLAQQDSQQPSASGARGGQARAGQGRGPAGDRGSVMNQMLADRVFLNLAESPSLGTATIRVSAEQGTVTLAGTVPSQQAEQRARRIARRTPGVREVVSQLQVDPGLAQPRSGAAGQVSDEELARRITQNLANQLTNARAVEEWLFGWEVEAADCCWEFDVDVDGSIVTLEGKVDSFDQLRRVVEIVRETPGVRAVNTELTIIGYPTYGPYPGYAYGPYAGYGYYDPYVGY